MKILLIKRKYIHTAINEKKRTVEAWIEPEKGESRVNLNTLFTYELDHNTCNANVIEARLLGMLMPVEWLDGKKKYRAKAVCSPNDTWNPEIGVEIAYFRLCRRYLRLLKRLTIRNFYAFLNRHSDYFDDFSKGDLCVYLPWGNARHTETEIFIDRRLEALYRKGGAEQTQEAHHSEELELLPCPFCGSKDARALFIRPWWWVRCRHCYTDGPKTKDRDVAIKTWNEVKRG